MGTYTIRKNGEIIKAELFDNELIHAMGLEYWYSPLGLMIGQQIDTFFLDGNELVRSRPGKETTWLLREEDLLPGKESVQFLGWCSQKWEHLGEEVVMDAYKDENVYSQFKHLFYDFFNADEYEISISF